LPDLPNFVLWITQFFSTSLSYQSACLSFFPPALQSGDLTARGAALRSCGPICQDVRVPFLAKFIAPIVEALLSPLNRLILPALNLYSRLSRFLSEEANRWDISVLGNSFGDWLCKQPSFLWFPVCQTVSGRELPPLGVCESVFRFWSQSRFPSDLGYESSLVLPPPLGLRALIARRSPAAHTDYAAHDGECCICGDSSELENPAGYILDLFVVLLFICDCLPPFVSRQHVECLLSDPLFHADVTVFDDCAYFEHLSSRRTYAIAVAVKAGYASVALVKWVQYRKLLIEVVRR
jgi:hypothetical protein